jgi:hypothetical protein
VADALDYVVDAADIYDEAFENVRAKLADAGIAVDGVPSES